MEQKKEIIHDFPGGLCMYIVHLIKQNFSCCEMATDYDMFDINVHVWVFSTLNQVLRSWVDGVLNS